MSIAQPYEWCDSDVLPAKLSKVQDYVRAHLVLERIPTGNGTADVAAVTAALGDDVAAVWVETPSATGAQGPNKVAIAVAGFRPSAAGIATASNAPRAIMAKEPSAQPE